MANRRSYFREAPMEEFTPANSINEETFRERRQGQLRSWVDETGKPVLRMTNAVLHLGLCTLLLAIMIEFLLWYRGHKRRLQTVALTSLVAVDFCLDIYAGFSLKKRWPGWAMALRLLLAMSYIAQFLVYVGYRKVFPSRYAYWGMAAEYSDAVLYILLLLLGIWNLLHTAIHRHTLGRDLHKFVGRIQANLVRSSQIDEGNQGDQGRDLAGSRLPTTNTPSRVEEVSDSNGTILLSELQADGKDPTLLVTDQSGKSCTTGESPSRRESMVHSKSDTVSAATSRRTSATTSDDKISHAEGQADISDRENTGTVS